VKKAGEPVGQGYLQSFANAVIQMVEGRRRKAVGRKNQDVRFAAFCHLKYEVPR